VHGFYHQQDGVILPMDRETYLSYTNNEITALKNFARDVAMDYSPHFFQNRSDAPSSASNMRSLERSASGLRGGAKRFLHDKTLDNSMSGTIDVYITDEMGREMVVAFSKTSDTINIWSHNDEVNRYTTIEQDEAKKFAFTYAKRHSPHLFSEKSKPSTYAPSVGPSTSSVFGYSVPSAPQIKSTYRSSEPLYSQASQYEEFGYSTPSAPPVESAFRSHKPSFVPSSTSPVFGYSTPSAPHGESAFRSRKPSFVAPSTSSAFGHATPSAPYGESAFRSRKSSFVAPSTSSAFGYATPSAPQVQSTYRSREPSYQQASRYESAKPQTQKSTGFSMEGFVPFHLRPE